MTGEKAAEAIKAYFVSERGETIAIIALALVLTIATIQLYLRGDVFAQGFAIMLGITAALSLSTALPLLFRDGARMEMLLNLLGTDIVAAVEQERARIGKVIANYPLYRTAYITLTVTAVTLLVCLMRPFWQGIAAGMLLFACIGLIIDHYSEARAKTYSAALGGTE